mmetsp:Transcript_10627/g.25974  ORF Transcript_10627/g.25974 Transcript_10627/m.25974 type:complete len:287 (+) Transcript_10627:234-1094(+)
MDAQRSSTAGRPTYFWGSQPYEMKYWPIVWVHSVLLITIWLYSAGASAGKPALAGYSNLENYGSVVLVLLSYAFLQHCLVALEGYLANSSNEQYVFAEKMSTHMLEQGLPFVISFLSYTLFVNRNVGVYLGVLFMLCRFSYPFLFAFYGRGTTLCLFAAQPMACIMFLMQLSTVMKIVKDYDLVGETSEGVMLVFVVFLSTIMMFCVHTVYGTLLGPILKQGLSFEALVAGGAGRASGAARKSDKVVEKEKVVAAPSRPLTPEEQAARDAAAKNDYGGKQIAGRRL